MPAEAIPGYCTFCRSRCGTLNLVEDGRLVAVSPLPGHPTGRAICPKGRAAPEIVHSSRRLTTPLRRTAPKGAPDPGWRPIAWDDAMGEIAGRLRAIRDESGPEAVAFAVTSPSATPISDSVEWIGRFIAAFGSPNTCNGTEICNWHKDFAHAFTFGCPMPLPDFARADLVILWGHNPSSVWLSAAGELAEARRRGSRLAVVDPRRTAHAADADQWVRVRPGSDAALALCLSHLLITSGRIDFSFVRGWTNAPFLVGANGRLLRDATGLPLVQDVRRGHVRPYDPALGADANGVDALALAGTVTVGGEPARPAFALFAERAAAYPVERAAALTGIPPDEIEAFATLIGGAARVAYHGWTGIGQGANATQTDRAIATLYALTGSFDAPGGNVVGSRLATRPIAEPGLLSPEQRAKALGAAQRPLGPAAQGAVTAEELYRSILDGEPYRVRALMTFGANLLASRADSDRGAKALAALDFAVHCDLFETPTGRTADILLPVSSPFEREGLRAGFEITPAAREHVQLRPAMVAPAGDVRSDAEIVIDLARRLDLDDPVLVGGIEAGWRRVLEPIGLTPDDLRAAPGGLRSPLQHPVRTYASEIAPGRVRGFATESGRVELYSERLARAGYDPLPAAAERRPRDPRYPLLLLSAKNPVFCHSQHRGVASLRRRSREPKATLSGRAAAERGIGPGDWIEIATRAGEARFVAEIDAALADDVVAAEFGWWQDAPDLGLPAYDPLAGHGSNFNRLIDGEEVDPVSGSTPLKEMPCEVSLAPVVGPRRWRGWRDLVVVGREVMPGPVTILDLAAPGGEALPPFVPGEHLRISVDPPGWSALERAYTLCGASHADGPRRYRIAVARARPDALSSDSPSVSAFCHDQLAVGARLRASSPAGTFRVPLDADFPVVLLVAGIGVTPALAYLEALAAGGRAAPEVVVHVGLRAGPDHPIRRRLARLAAACPSVRLVGHDTQLRETASPRDGSWRAGRITADAVDADLVRRRARFYLCGPPDMIRHVTDGLVRRGVPRFEIVQEIFRPQQAASSGAEGPFAVRFARSDVTATWTPAGGSLLRLAESSAVSAPSGCRTGGCESCSATVLSGRFEHLVATADLPEDVCLTCQAVPTSDIVLDL